MQSGGGPTFEEVVRDHGAWIRRKLVGFGVRARDLDDVAQEVLLGVWRGLPAFDASRGITPAAALRGWLHRVCERQAASYHRSPARWPESSLHPCEGLAGAEASGLEEAILQRERARLFLRAVAELPGFQQAVFVAHELEGVPMADASQALGIPENTAWNRLRLARETLRAALHRHFGHKSASRSPR